MPYTLDGNCVKKESGETVPGGCHKTRKEALAHLRALEANVNDSKSAIQEMSLVITKASFETNEADPNKRMRFRMSSSDTGKDLSDEAMSLELYKSFVSRIKANTSIPEAFKSICEDDWCGGMPYLSVAHYKSGRGNKNVPGIIEEIFVDGDVLKSKGYCLNNALGRAVFDSLLEDQQKRKSGVADFDPVRVSIGFLDLIHKHQPEDGGPSTVFVRESLSHICPLCEQGIGGKIYLDGILVHEAVTRVPMNPRTLMVVEDSMTQKSEADGIQTKRDDARSIIGDLADALDDGLEQKSALTIKAIEEGATDGSDPVPDPSLFNECLDPNTGGYDQGCIDRKVSAQMVGEREQMNTVKSTLLDGVLKSILKSYKISGLPIPAEVLMEVTTPQVITKTQDEDADDKGDGKEKEEMKKHPDEKEEKSTLDTSFESLKSLLGKGSREDIQAAFNLLGTEVEKAYVPSTAEISNVNAQLLQEVKNLSATVQGLTIKLAALEAGQVNAPVTTTIPRSRALQLQPEIMRSQAPAAASQKQLSQIQRIARASTGLQE